MSSNPVSAKYTCAPSPTAPQQGPSNNRGTKSASKLRDNCNTGDFRAWNDHDAYQRTLERLLRALRVKTKTA